MRWISFEKRHPKKRKRKRVGVQPCVRPTPCCGPKIIKSVIFRRRRMAKTAHNYSDCSMRAYEFVLANCVGAKVLLAKPIRRVLVCSHMDPNKNHTWASGSALATSHSACKARCLRGQALLAALTEKSGPLCVLMRDTGLKNLGIEIMCPFLAERCCRTCLARNGQGTSKMVKERGVVATKRVLVQPVLPGWQPVVPPQCGWYDFNLLETFNCPHTHLPLAHLR